VERASSELSFDEVLRRVRDDERFFPQPNSRPPLGTDPAWELIEFGSNRVPGNGRSDESHSAPESPAEASPET